MKGINSIRVNSIWMVIGNTVYALSLWLILILVAKLTDPESVGAFTLGFAITAPVIMLANLRLRFILATDNIESNEFSEYFSLRVITTFSALIFVAAVLFIFDFDKRLTFIIAIIAVAKGIEAISDIFYGLLHKHEEMKRIAISMVLKGVFSVILFGGAIYYTGDIAIALICLIVSWGVVLVFMDINAPLYLHNVGVNNFAKSGLLFPKLLININQDVIKRIFLLAKKAAPLGIVALLMSLSTNIPRYIIGYEHGVRALGFYAAITYVMIASILVLSSVGQSAMPRLAKLASQHDYSEFKYLLYKLIVFAIACGILGGLISCFYGESILGFMYGDEYAEYSAQLNWVMLAAGLNYIALFLWYAMTALKSYIVQLYIFSVDVVLILFLSLFLIPNNGIYGAVMALVILMAFHVVVASIIIRIILRDREIIFIHG